MSDFEFKKHLQEHLSDGLAVVVGSGLSCAEGLPGMVALTQHLQNTLASSLDVETLEEWTTLSSVIEAKGLEPALMEQEPSEELDRAIRDAVVACLVPRENLVIAEVVSGARTLRFTKLLPHLLKEVNGLPILTTNYDRLIEVACEAAGLPVDTMFDGAVLGRPDAKTARENLLRVAGLKGSQLRKRFREHARVFKPHGSLDWYRGYEGPVRFAGELELPRMIVAPGRRKLRHGYDRPYDEHRETMNRILDRSARLLVIGYGFNDDHLQTRLVDLIHRGTPTVLLTRELSPAARSIAMEYPMVTALEREGDDGTRIIHRQVVYTIERLSIWDLGIFVDEVLAP